jgi:glycosyltransferase involved in cell wall biosynthesis
MSLPLVSCIMPTRDRPEFMKKAVEYFLRQTHPNKELLILDDGTRFDSLVSWATASSDDNDKVSILRYVPNSRFKTLGAKRNWCVKHSRGDLIAHWDDDDWYESERLSLQVAAMGDANAEICGVEAPIFYDLPSGNSFQYRYRGPGRYLYSATLMYSRDYWARSTFPALQVGASTPFVCGPGRLDKAAFMSPDWYTGISHLRNNSPKVFGAAEFTRWEGDVKSRLGADWSFYQSLRP